MQSLQSHIQFVCKVPFIFPSKRVKEWLPSPAEEEHIDINPTVVVVWELQHDRSNADRDEFPLNRTNMIVDALFMLKVAKSYHLNTHLNTYFNILTLVSTFILTLNTHFNTCLNSSRLVIIHFCNNYILVYCYAKATQCDLTLIIY